MKEKIKEYIQEQLASSDTNKLHLIKQELKTIGGKYVTDGFRIGYLIGAAVAYDFKCYYVLLNKDAQIIFILSDQDINVVTDQESLDVFKNLNVLIDTKPYDLKESVELEMAKLVDILITPLYIGNKKMFIPQQTILTHNGDEVGARLGELINKEGSQKTQQNIKALKEKREFIQNIKQKLMETTTQQTDIGNVDVADNYEFLQNKYIHLLADFDNYKKRVVKEKEEIKRSANEKLLLNIIELVDDMERGLEYTNDEGLIMIYNKFKKFLTDNNVKPIPTNGEKYDCELHEAVSIVECGQNGRIIKTIEKGYYLNDKVIRYAKVIVGN